MLMAVILRWIDPNGRPFVQELNENQIELPEGSSHAFGADREVPSNNENQKREVEITNGDDLEEGMSSSVEEEKAMQENLDLTAVEKNTELEIPNEKGAVLTDPVEELHEELKDAKNNIQANVTGETEIATNTEQDPEDGMSDTGSSDGEMMEVISFNGDDDGTISIPMAGECRPAWRA